MQEIQGLEHGISWLLPRDNQALFVIGLSILAANLFWLWIQMFLGVAVIYNLKEEGQYKYLGEYWIEDRKGDLVLQIPDRLIEKSMTTQYKLHLGRWFAKVHQGKILQIRFGQKERICVQIERDMLVKNHIATYTRL